MRARVLQIFSRYLNPGGEENSVYRIGDALQKEYDVEYYLGSTHDLLGTSVSQKLTAPLRAYHNPKSCRELSRYQEVGKFDIWLIHNVFPGLSPSVYKTAFRLGVPIIHYLHNYRLGCVNGFFLNHGSPCEKCLHGNFWPAFLTGCWHGSRLISGIEACVTRRARHLGVFPNVSAWIALSQAQRRKHVEMGIPSEKIHAVPHFYEPALTPPPPSPDGDILFLGRLSPEKGVDCLLRAWKLAPPSGRRLKIAGDGPEMAKLRFLTRELGLSNVDFLGFVDQKDQREIWSQASFSVIPSIWSEPFPLAFLEAWGNGRPFVSNRLGAMAEVVQEGVDGLLAKPFDPASLAQEIQKLISSPSLCLSMGKAGRERIEREFNRAVWMDRIRTIFNTVLNKSPASLR